MQKEQDNTPQTGPEAIEYALSQLTPQQINERGKKILASGKRSKRSYGVKLLNIARGLERNQLKPSDYMISAVPVIPPKYRPFAVQGDTMIPGDANILYKDLIDIKDAYDEETKMFGKANTQGSQLTLYDAVRSVYGYGDAVKPKTRSKDVQGFLKKIVGSTSKFSYVASKMISKPQDNVGRSTTIADPDLSIDEIGVPREMAMTMYAPYVQRRLKGMGYSDADALRAVRDRTDDAWRALQRECEVRPVLYSRAPAWYKFNITAGKVKLIDGKALATNPIVQHSYSGDFDGNCIKFDTLIRVKVDATCDVYNWIAEQIQGSMGGDYDRLRSKKIKFALDTDGNWVYADIVMKVTPNTKVVLRTPENMELVLPIESIPYFPETLRYDRHGAEVYNVPEGISILSTAVDGKGTRWSTIETITREKGCKLRRVVTRKGREVVVSSNESLAVFSPVTGLTKIKPDDATQGQLIPYVKQMPGTGNEGTFDLGWILGLFLSDGTFDGKDLTLSKRSDTIRTSFLTRLKSVSKNPEAIDAYLRTYRELHDAATNCGIGGESVKLAIYAKALPEEVKQLFAACYPPDLDRAQEVRSRIFKQLPQEVHRWGTDAILGLLCGLLVGDGTISISHSKAKPQLLVNISTSSPGLRDGIIYIGKRLGVGVSYSTTKPKAGRVQVHDNYTVTLSTADLKKYADALQLDPQYDEAIQLLHEVTDNPHDVTPVPAIVLEAVRKLPDDVLQRFGILRGVLNGKISDARKNPLQYAGIMREKAKAYAQACFTYLVDTNMEDTKLVNAATYALNAVEDTTTGWEYVKEVTKVPTELVYDVAVPDTKVFAIENGLIIYDTINVHVPASDDAVKEAWEKMMPSKDPFSDRDPEKLVLLPMQEQILGNYTAATAPATKPVVFNSEEEALTAIKQGQIPLSADVEIRGWPKAASQKKVTEEEPVEPAVVKGPVRDPKTGKWMQTRNTNVEERKEPEELQNK